MAKTSNVFAHVEPEVKAQAEKVLNQLGMPMSSAINVFLRQVVLHNGLPFEMKLPDGKVLDVSALDKEQFDSEISKGISDIKSGKVIAAENVRDEMRQEYRL